MAHSEILPASYKSKPKIKKKKKGKSFIDKSKSITFHLVQRSSLDPLTQLPEEYASQFSEWILEPDIDSREKYERVQNFFYKHNIEEALPYTYRSDEFIEKTSIQSFRSSKTTPLPSKKNDFKNLTKSQKIKELIKMGFTQNEINEMDLNNIQDFELEMDYENENDIDFYQDYKDSESKTMDQEDDEISMAKEVFGDTGFDYSQYFREIKGTGTFLKWDPETNAIQKPKKIFRKNTNVSLKTNEKSTPKQIKKKVIVEHDNEVPYYLKDLKCDDFNEIDKDPEYKDYLELLNSDDEKETTKVLGVDYEGDLQEDIVFDCLGIKKNELQQRQNKKIQIGFAVPFGSEFGNEDATKKIKDKWSNIDVNSSSKYDQMLSSFMNCSMDDIDENKAMGQFEDALDDTDDDDDKTEVSKGVAYDADKDFLDNQFEIMLNKEYDDELIGDIEENNDEFIGFKVAERFSKPKNTNLRYQYYRYLKNKRNNLAKCLKKHSKKYTKSLLEIDEEEQQDEKTIDQELELEFKPKPKEKWDVESVLSVRTNHENHPLEVSFKKKEKNPYLDTSLLEEIKIDFSVEEMKKFENKHSIVEEVPEKEIKNEFNFGNLTTIKFEYDEDYESEENKDDKKDNLVDKKQLDVVYKNRKNESKDEKKERKKAIKDMRKDRRKKKKDLKFVFKNIEGQQKKLFVSAKKSHCSAYRL